MYHGHIYTEKLELKTTKYITSWLLDTHLFPFFSHRESSTENSYYLSLPLHTILVSWAQFQVFFHKPILVQIMSDITWLNPIANDQVSHSSATSKLMVSRLIQRHCLLLYSLLLLVSVVWFSLFSSSIAEGFYSSMLRSLHYTTSTYIQSLDGHTEFPWLWYLLHKLLPSNLLT